MESPAAQDAVSCSIDARGVATVTLEKPEKHNAFDDAMIAALTAHFRSLAEKEEVRVVVLAAEGRSFSAGADLAWMQRMASYDYGHNLDDARALAQMLESLRNLPKPTIARVQGSAFGGAIGLICCCDVAVSSRNARFALTETRIGLIPATIGPHVLEAIGPRWTRRLFLTAERIEADLAERIGLVHEAVEADELDARIAALAGQFLGNGPIALREAKLLLRELTYRPLDAGIIDDTSARIAHLRVSGEGQEGLRAFLDKREPTWRQGGAA